MRKWALTAARIDSFREVGQLRLISFVAHAMSWRKASLALAIWASFKSRYRNHA